MGLHLLAGHAPRVGGRGPVGLYALVQEEHLNVGSARTTHLENQKVGTRGGEILLRRSNGDNSVKETKGEREKIYMRKGCENHGSRPERGGHACDSLFPWCLSSYDSGIFCVGACPRARIFMSRPRHKIRG